jgi:hypothetical protein
MKNNAPTGQNVGKQWNWYYNIDSYLDIHYDEKIEPINYEAYLASLPA